MNTGPSTNLGAPSVIYGQKATSDSRGSGTTSYQLFFNTLQAAQAQIAVAYFAGWRYSLSIETGYCTVDLEIGYNQFSQNNGGGETEPQSQWTITPNYIEKPLLESGLPIVATLSIKTKEAIIAALKNPGKNLPPSPITAELPQALVVYNLMRGGTESVPYSTVTLSRKIRVSQQYIATWAFSNPNTPYVMSKNYVISNYQIPAWVQAVMPNSFNEDLGNGLIGFWGYREVREPYQEAPGNQVSIGQSLVYDRWITSLGGGYNFYTQLGS